MGTSISEPLAPQTYLVPNVGGITTAVNNLGTVGQQVIGPDPARRTITFGNPNVSGQVNLLIYQVLDANGNALAPTFAAPGGGWILMPGAILQFAGDVQGAWGAVAASGNSNGLTVISSRS